MQANPFLGQILRSSASGYAGLAAQRFVERAPDVAERYGRGAFELWRANLATRLTELSSALTDARPEQFADQVSWSRLALRTRGVPEEDLRASLACLHEVLLQELTTEAQASVAPFFEVARESLEREVESPDDILATLSQDEQCSSLANQFVCDILAGDAHAARKGVIDAVQSGKLSAEAAMTDLLMPALRVIGRLWHLNEIDVGVEHLGTATTKETLAQLQLFATPRAALDKTALIATAPNDGHDLGTLIATRFFELDGWRVVHLGADMPSDELPNCVERFQPDVVVLSATLDEHRRGLKAGIEALRAKSEGAPPKVIVAGPAFGSSAELWRSTGADATASSPQQACVVARELVGVAANGKPG